jgi:hypothetical protein
MLAKQVLNCQLFLLFLLWRWGVLFLCPDWPGLRSSCFRLPAVAGMIDVYYLAQPFSTKMVSHKLLLLPTPALGLPSSWSQPPK